MGSSILSSLRSAAWLVPGWRRMLLFAVPPVLGVAVVAALLVFGSAPGATSQPPQAGAGAANVDAENASSLPPPAGLLIDVAGAVARPGLYRVAKGDRVSAAIAAAGGLTSDADPNRLPDMAGLLKDGQQVRVPSVNTPVRSSSSSSSPRIVKISLNTATRDQLATIPGFTPDLAATVVQYRTEFGGFQTTRELVTVLNMSQADYALARRYVRV